MGIFAPKEKSKLRSFIKKNVDEQTEKYRSDNVAILNHYKAENSRLMALADSMRYAAHLQTALLPSEKDLQDIAGESFFIAVPRDTLSGDFTWFTRSGSKIIIAVSDCTGHGVPGALMGVLGISLLNQVVLEERCFEPSFILRRLDEKLRKTFHAKNDNQRGSYDGMDISLCRIDTATGKISYAGAMRSAWIIHEEMVTELKGARYPLGGLRLEENREYPSIEMTYVPGSMLYMFTDGYTDQFGGPSSPEGGKKLTRRRLRDLAVYCHRMNMREQRDQFLEFFLLWKDQYEQVDDVTLLGVRLR
ncbi:MAG TPA: SpoIIE family protein phosphatase [Bacteroidia bacterium]|nr:SpoIIE family protein phosphatase [Bacteroidia bacterium]